MRALSTLHALTLGLIVLSACGGPRGGSSPDASTTSDTFAATDSAAPGDDTATADLRADGPADAVPADAGDPSPGEFEQDGAPLAACPLPQAPTLGVVHEGARLVFRGPDDATLETGTSLDPAAEAPEAWLASPEVVLSGPSLGGAGLPLRVRVFARTTEPACADGPTFAFDYEIRAGYAPAAGQPGATAIHADDPAIAGWAIEATHVAWGADVDDTWRVPAAALGPAGDDAPGVVPLGNGGALTLRFEPPIANGPGPDLAVFENALDDTFLELARVEVSSDGLTFERFDCVYLGETPVGAYAGHDPSLFTGLAGHDRAGFGTPFDLAELANRPGVGAGLVDLGAIRYVRVVDVVGDGSEADSFGHPIYDPFPTTGSGGFDLDAIAALHVAP